MQSIGLTPRTAQAQVVIGLDSDAAPLHQGTIARIYENSLSGIANKYVVLEPGPQTRSGDPGGRRRSRSTDSYSHVSLDQLFDTLDPATRDGLRGFIRGEAASIEGKAARGEPRRSSTSRRRSRARAT